MQSLRNRALTAYSLTVLAIAFGVMLLPGGGKRSSRGARKTSPTPSPERPHCRRA
jgi:hypothetical protein